MGELIDLYAYLGAQVATAIAEKRRLAHRDKQPSNNSARVRRQQTLSGVEREFDAKPKINVVRLPPSATKPGDGRAN